MAKSRNIKNSFAAINPSSSYMNFLSVTPFTSLLFSTRRTPTTPKISKQTAVAFSLIFFAFMFVFSGISLLAFMHKSRHSLPDSLVSSSSPFPFPYHSLLLASAYPKDDDESLSLSRSVMVPLPSHMITGDNISKEEAEFWRQPNGEGYQPCLEFSLGYRKASAKISMERRKFLVVVVSGGLNQQRNQIADAVVIARILGAALVVPILRLNLIWQDESQFSEIFDVEHFKMMLRADINIVSFLPSTHSMPRHSVEMPRNASPLWIRARFLKKLNREGVLLLKWLDSKLSKNLALDLQRLRCKVAFHAIRFTAPIMNLGNRLARRVWIEGPYIALHLRLEKDVWERTGCPTGLGPEFDQIIERVYASQPEHLIRHLNMSYIHRRLAGLCPLNALEMARLLEALGVPSSAQIYVAGGEPFGGAVALKQLEIRFPNLVLKETVARGQELLPFMNKSSALAAIDYIVSLSSDVFIPSHGGNMGRLMQGHRAYVGHRKHITPNKRAMVPLFDSGSLSDSEYGRIVRELHKNSQGQPERRTNKQDRDVLAYPVPECMCNKGLHRHYFSI